MSQAPRKPYARVAVTWTALTLTGLLFACSASSPHGVSSDPTVSRPDSSAPGANAFSSGPTHTAERASVDAGAADAAATGPMTGDARPSDASAAGLGPAPVFHTPTPEGFPDPPTDAGNLLPDSGTPHADSGTPHADSGTPHADSGPDAGVPNVLADKADLLFVIDNSGSMSDKQGVFTDALPRLVQRLVNPLCVQADGTSTTAPESPTAACPEGSVREFAPLTDIHVAVITTSLGDFGADDGACTPDGTAARSERNDAAYLLGLLPRGQAALASTTDANSGFLHWGPDSDVDSFQTAFASLVNAVGEFGCGYEASLESWYRFLVDPTPYTKLVRNDCGIGAPRQCVGPEVDEAGMLIPDTNLLAQRQAFLRPDSVLAIVMLSDENDCSFRTTGQSWRLSELTSSDSSEFTAQFKSSLSCEIDPESPCCFTCAMPAVYVPEGCSLEAEACVVNGGPAKYPAWGSEGVGEPPSPDNPNLRCFKQKSRFGIDYLFPVERYSNALKERLICPSASDLRVTADCPGVVNPLYDDLSTADPAHKRPPRSSASIFLAGILGVPWQDLAVDPQATSLEYRKTPGEPGVPNSGVNWGWLLGDDPLALEPIPNDILLREQVEPRDTVYVNPAPAGNAAPVTAGRDANLANGHEWDTSTDLASLQSSCIFPIAPRDCPEQAAPVDFTLQISGCECTTYGNSINRNPACQAADGSYGLTQYYARAFPPLRELQVFHEYAENSIITSICPKVTDPARKDDAEYGYNPAIAAIVDRLKDRLVR